MHLRANSLSLFGDSRRSRKSFFFGNFFYICEKPYMVYTQRKLPFFAKCELRDQLTTKKNELKNSRTENLYYFRNNENISRI